MLSVRLNDSFYVIHLRCSKCNQACSDELHVDTRLGTTWFCKACATTTPGITIKQVRDVKLVFPGQIIQEEKKVVVHAPVTKQQQKKKPKKSIKDYFAKE